MRGFPVVPEDDPRFSTTMEPSELPDPTNIGLILLVFGAGCVHALGTAMVGALMEASGGLWRHALRYGVLDATAAALLSRAAANLLYGVDPLDPWTYLAAGLSLSTVALLACWVPARRAARVALPEHAPEILEREAHVEGALDQPDARKRLRGVDAVAVRAAVRRREQPFLLVVAERIGAHARLPRQLPGSHSFRIVSGSPVP